MLIMSNHSFSALRRRKALLPSSRKTSRGLRVRNCHSVPYDRAPDTVFFMTNEAVQTFQSLSVPSLR